MTSSAGIASTGVRQSGNRILRELRRIHLYVLPVLWSAFIIFCVYWIVVSSLKSNQEVFSDPWGFPEKLQFENFSKMWQAANLGVALRNSLIITVGAVLLILVVCAPAAYVLGRIKFKGSGWLTVLFIAGAGVPAAMLIIPLFSMLSTLKLINTFQGLILIYLTVSIPFSLYVLTGFFATLPSEFEEAARIDGCSELDVFWRIMLPLASPGMLTVAIFNFVAIWNEYGLALVFIQNQDRMPLARALYAIAGSMIYTGNWVGLFAAVVVVMVPSLLVYLLLSERLIEGITAGALK